MTTEKQRVAVVGAGGVGGFFAAHLSGSSHEVIACVRRPFDTWLIESDEAPFQGPAVAITDPTDVPWEGPANWVFVGVKAHQTDGATNWFDRLCGPDTTVVGMQNGVEEKQRLTPLVHGATVIPAAVYCGTELLAPGHIRHRQKTELIVPNDAAGAALQQLCAQVDTITIRPHDKFLDKTWLKLVTNVVINGLCAVSGENMTVLSDPTLGAVAADMMRECIAVANAEGAQLRSDGIDDRIAFLGTLDSTPSTLQDVRAGRSTEHEALHGAVIRLGAAHGIDTPITRVVHAILEGRSQAIAQKSAN